MIASFEDWLKEFTTSICFTAIEVVTPADKTIVRTFVGGCLDDKDKYAADKRLMQYFESYSKIPFFVIYYNVFILVNNNDPDHVIDLPEELEEPLEYFADDLSSCEDLEWMGSGSFPVINYWCEDLDWLIK